MNSLPLCEQLAARLLAKGWMLSTAESCTGGLIASACTDLAGSSAWFDCGFITYSYNAKTAMLGVAAELLVQQGAVSEPVACAMALGALTRSRSRVAVAVTGVAGPAGGTADKPVGTVWFCWNVDGQITAERMHFDGDRGAVRSQTVEHALRKLLVLLGPAV
ncbi:MAG: CinA family protein [Bdellovibrionales bacterium]|nr:CinA family protein [Ramlibacter sp.]